MTDVKQLVNSIEDKSNGITAKLEILRTLEEQKEGIDNEIKKAKEKLENDTITKFTYATMQELNQKNLETNTNERKKVWNEIAEFVNDISNKLNILKETYNQKAEIESADEIKKEDNTSNEEK
jgi:hypothetical protein